MKKLTVYLLAILAVAVVSFSFISCGDPDDPDNPNNPDAPIIPDATAGVYQPTKKMGSMYVQMDEDPEYLVENWEWNGNKVASVTYFEEGEFVARDEYEYNGNRLAKITDNQGFYSEYYYLNTKFEKITYFTPTDVVAAHIQFHYEGNKVTMITMTTFGVEKNVIGMIERGLVGKLLPEEGKKIVAEKLANPEKESIVISLAYSGDNISQVSVGNYIISYSNYDAYFNVQYNFFPFLTHDASFYYNVFSKNNPEKSIIQVGTSIVNITYAYTYADGYPTTINSTMSYGTTSSVAKTRIVYN